MPEGRDDAPASEGVGPGSEVLAWLEPRLRRVPDDLAAAVRASVRRVLEDGGRIHGDPGSRRRAPSTGEGGDPPGSSSDSAVDALPGPVAGVLARAALAELERVTGMRGRRAALALLAADASLTYAFEAAGDDGTDPAALADLVGLRGALGRRLTAPERSAGT